MLKTSGRQAAASTNANTSPVNPTNPNPNFFFHKEYAIRNRN